MTTKTPALEYTSDPMVSVTEQFTIFHHFLEEERGPVVSEMIANNGYEAIANAMVLARPYAGEVFTAMWFDCNGTKREVSVKVLDRK